MFTCEVETTFTDPHGASAEHAKHRTEAQAKLGAKVIMTGASTSSHPKPELAAHSDPANDYIYRTKTYWRSMTPEEVLAEREAEMAAAAQPAPQPIGKF